MRPRPAPSVVKARLAEIKRRYRRKRRRHSSRTQFAAIRISELNRVIRARYGHFMEPRAELPNDETGRAIVVIVAHHLVRLAGTPQARLLNWARDWAPWLSVVQIDAVLHEVIDSPQTWKADTLAWRLRLTDTERSALRIGTIGAIDCNKHQREARRRKNTRLRERERRRQKRLAKQAACPP